MKDTQLLGEINTIALATDGSDFSDGAVQEAIFMGQEYGANLVVIHVIPITTETATLAHASSASVRIKAKNYIQNILQMTADNGIDCKVLFEESYQPDKTIVELAYQENADVILMGRHGEKGLLKLLVGSMTSKVIGHGFPKVMVVPKTYAAAADKILLATDGSPFSQMAAEEALSMSKNCSTLKEVYVVSVAIKEANIDQAKQRAESICKKAMERKLDTKYIPITAVGRPSEVITEIAREKNVDMILIGGHGKGLTKLLMGHVTEKVIGHVQCSVLVVEGEQ